MGHVGHAKYVYSAAMMMLLAAASTHAAGIIYSLERGGSTSVLTGTPLVIDVRATFSEPLSAAAFGLTASGTAAASLTARTANPLEPNGLTFISTIQQNPFQNGLPLNLKNFTSIEVLADLDFQPPASDGLAPGSNVLLERITVVPSGTGTLTISLSQASGVTTQGGANGVSLTPVSYGKQSITFNIQAAPVCKNPRFDIDGDGDVDQVDFGVFQSCMTAPGDPYGDFVPNPCLCFDKNNNQAIDIGDYQAFQLCVSGPRIPANPTCDD